MNDILSFDLETVPDTCGIRQLHHLPDSLSDNDVVDFMAQQMRIKNGSDFMPLHLQRIVSISCCFRHGAQGLNIGTLPAEDEAQMIQAFFDLIRKYSPQLVSWNGTGFDLPVLHYRSLIHQIKAPEYWEVGDNRKDFRYNNYINRYHLRHCDVMDLLSLYQARAAAPLDDIAKLCGFPGKLGMDGSQVWQAFCDGKLREIRDYCETDALNTYLVFLRLEQMRGLDIQTYDEEIAFIRAYLEEHSDKVHWREFLEAWTC